MRKLIIFVKAPVPGKVKTRLVPPLTYEQAAEMYKGWTQEIFKTASCLDSTEIEIAYQPHPDFPKPDWLLPEQERSPHESAVGLNFRILPRFFLQEGKNLGERLFHAFNRAFGCDAQRVVILGSDSPGLPLAYLHQAFGALEQHDLVLGPAQDGGYYLIGLREKTIPKLFQNISWSTAVVFSQTLEAAKEQNLSVFLLPPYFDIDTAEALKLLKRVEGFKEELKI